MSIPLSALKGGKSYLTNSGRMCRIIRRMPDGRVLYEHRADNAVAGTGKAGMATTLPTEVEIVREVLCD